MKNFIYKYCWLVPIIVYLAIMSTLVMCASWQIEHLCKGEVTVSNHDTLSYMKDAQLSVNFRYEYVPTKDVNTYRYMWITPENQLRLDTICQTIKVNQEQIIKKQDELVDSIRQETNNNLDKLNLWLTFWIGIISFFNVLFPIASQLYLIRESKEEIKKIDKKNRIVRLSTLVNSIQVGMSNRLLDDEANRNFFYRNTWEKMLNIAEEMLEDYRSSSGATSKGAYELSLCLLYIRTTLQERKLASKRRTADKLLIELSKTSSDIISGSLQGDELYKRFKKHICTLRNIDI